MQISPSSARMVCPAFHAGKNYPNIPQETPPPAMSAVPAAGSADSTGCADYAIPNSLIL